MLLEMVQKGHTNWKNWWYQLFKRLVLWEHCLCQTNDLTTVLVFHGMPRIATDCHGFTNKKPVCSTNPHMFETMSGFLVWINLVHNNLDSLWVTGWTQPDSRVQQVTKAHCLLHQYHTIGNRQSYTDPVVAQFFGLFVSSLECGCPYIMLTLDSTSTPTPCIFLKKSKQRLHSLVV